MTSNKENIYQNYDKISDWFDTHRSRDLFEKSWLDKAIKLLPKNTHILDLGCGMGEPITSYFLKKGCVVTGLDSSKKLILLAKSRYPEVEFIVSDMRTLNLTKKFHFIIAWHSFFHLQPKDQRAMFEVFKSYLNINGVLLFTSGTEAGEVWSNNGGENLYHSSLSPGEYKNLLNEHNFRLIDHKLSDPECGGATVWLAMRE